MKIRNFFFLFVTILAPSIAMPQSGGTFVIQKSVIAGGGGSASGGSFAVNNTIGEAVAGTTSFGGTFDLGGGFWGGGTPLATFSVSGRVFTGAGAPLRNAIVSISNNRTGALQVTATGPSGTYQFTNVQAGDIYAIAIGSKRYRFDVLQLFVNGDQTSVDFVGNN